MFPWHEFIWNSILHLKASVFVLNTYAMVGNETDRLALLEFKATISHDPFMVFSSWNETTHFCLWYGVTCGHRHLRIIELILASRKLTGSISPFIGNLSFLRIQCNNRLIGKFVVFTNNLGGSIPNAQGQLRNLTTIVLSESKLSSNIPPSIFNLSSIRFFHVEVNQLRGSLSFELGITTLRNLLDLSIAYNQFIGSIPPSISNASNLEVLQIAANKFTNKFTGNVPSLENLHRLKIFIAFRNNVGGSGEADHNLSFLIQTNNFGCVLPKCIGHLSLTLKMFVISANKITGMIPSGILNLVNLEVLKFEENLVSGNIPTVIGRLHRLKRLDLLRNNLSRNIPHSLGNLTLLLELVLGVNNLGGSIPSSLSNCKSLISLNLFRNDLNGSIPKQIFVGNIKNLGALYIAGNMLSGPILPSFGSLSGIQTFCRSWNNLSGRILDFLWLVPTDGVFKNLSSALVTENNQLCGGIPEMNLPKCNFKESWNTKLTSTLKEKQKLSTSSSSGNFLLNISYQSLLIAIDGFSSANLLGVGGFGSVYIGILDESGTIVAVKVLNLLCRGAFKSFLVECEALRNIRNRNLVKVLTVCLSVDYHGNDFKVLAYEFMINGSLEEWLHPTATEDEVHQNQRNPDMFQRLDITIDIASAFNVLLDSEMIGHLGDFGIAIFSPGSNYKIKGNYCVVSNCRDTLNLHSFVKTTLSQEIVEISDPSLFQERKDEKTRNNGQNNFNITRRNKTQECLVLIFKIGVACSLEQPEKQMNVRDVVAELNLIRKMLTREKSLDIHNNIIIHPTIPDLVFDQMIKMERFILIKCSKCISRS
ncbi:hypothetical protein I3842_14G112000 [Carya illinoinensis]|uniref:Protein kinase domain-containing protein n=1 Tax=Carya illinoinensis TaxID=32201 RepID=A0A922ACV4_CARIL|nr:hypothetical protein I3842_14G112000 [Carya illinoinensis]